MFFFYVKPKLILNKHLRPNMCKRYLNEFFRCKYLKELIESNPNYIFSKDGYYTKLNNSPYLDGKEPITGSRFHFNLISLEYELLIIKKNKTSLNFIQEIVHDWIWLYQNKNISI